MSHRAPAPAKTVPPRAPFPAREMRRVPPRIGRGGDDGDPPGERALGADPLSDTVIEEFYRPAPPAPSPRSLRGEAKAKPTHYKIVCISLYVEDIERLDEKVRELKRRGHTRANRSQLIRVALDQVDLTKVPRTY